MSSMKSKKGQRPSPQEKMGYLDCLASERGRESEPQIQADKKKSAEVLRNCWRQSLG